MQIVLAPDSFKGSLSAVEVVESLAQGLNKANLDIEITELPMADGGEGTVKSLVNATGGRIVEEEVLGPLGDSITAQFGILGDGSTAVIEMAAASGLPLVPEGKRDPTKTTTYGTGQLIATALDQGCRDLIIGIGGSATNDCGIGMAQALGAEFLDSSGTNVGFGGGELKKIEKIDLSNLDNRIQECNIEVACDVDNPLYGKDGAAYVYASQKGADQVTVEKLDQGLRKFAVIIEQELDKDVAEIPGAGAAGGLGAGLVAFLEAELKSGVEIVIDAIDLAKKVVGADLVITGEGMIDQQTVFGKTPIGVAKTAKKYDVPVIAVAGSLGAGAEEVYDGGIDAFFSMLDKPMQLEKAQADADRLLEKWAENLGRMIKIAKGLSFK
ncbi:MAG: glycerate kinase [Bacillota bacterium]